MEGEQTMLANSIQESANYLLTLVNNILDFSKIDSGHMDIEKVQFSPTDVVRDLLVMMRYQAKEKNIQLGEKKSHRLTSNSFRYIIGEIAET